MKMFMVVSNKCVSDVSYSEEIRPIAISDSESLAIGMAEKYIYDIYSEMRKNEPENLEIEVFPLRQLTDKTDDGHIKPIGYKISMKIVDKRSRNAYIHSVHVLESVRNLKVDRM